ncbi:hypothetical protein LCGC14_2242320 [marine sediment metagenome]|uniref:Uncharacterized protein n=1 Tax=marine sediment metagenome TaxID=412755 RepID=A0A0F9DSN8_9ZZZZ
MKGFQHFERKENMKRHKRAEAVALQYSIICPYKACGMLVTVDSVKKGEIVECSICRKGIHIVKVR